MSSRGRCGDSTTPSPGWCARWRPPRPSRPLPNSASSSGSAPNDRRIEMATNGKTQWHFTIRHPNGEPLVAFLVECEPTNGESRTAGPATEQNPPARQQAATNGAANGEAKMTEPQKRYLFRLLGA